MEFVPYRVLRNEPAALREKLEDQGELVISVDGKPFALMLSLSNIDNLEDLLILVSRLRAQMAVRSIRSQARRNKTENLSDEQVDEIIKQTRTGKK